MREATSELKRIEQVSKRTPAAAEVSAFVDDVEQLERQLGSQARPEAQQIRELAKRSYGSRRLTEPPAAREIRTGTTAAPAPDMRTNLMKYIVGASLIAGAACGTQRGTGAAGGAVAGGIVGAALGGEEGLLIGAAVGGALGYVVGSEMDRQDERRFVIALEQNRPVVWRNPNTGRFYRVEPRGQRMFRGRQCREFQLFADDGRGRGPDTVFGTACRTRGGAWELVQG